MLQIIIQIFSKAKTLLIFSTILGAVFISGLQYFVLNFPENTHTHHQQTDGIVVITGGQQRLDAGLSLLANGTSSKLLISGVGTGISKIILADELGLNDVERALIICCAELEYDATDTRGNAFATRKWAEVNQLSSLYLVTANYHMPRARIAFKREMPYMTFRYWPVSPEDLHIERWWAEPKLIRLLVREYLKFLAEFMHI